jgi:hypothetical protein
LFIASIRSATFFTTSSMSFFTILHTVYVLHVHHHGSVTATVTSVTSSASTCFCHRQWRGAIFHPILDCSTWWCRDGIFLRSGLLAILTRKSPSVQILYQRSWLFFGIIFIFEKWWIHPKTWTLDVDGHTWLIRAFEWE